MTERDFVYWLQGFFEINKPESITDEQVKVIKEHLDKVVTYVAPMGHQQFVSTDKLILPRLDRLAVTC